MNKNVEGLKLSLCQMNVIPGRPDLNTNYIVHEIEEAIRRGVDIIFFTELGVTGYFIGDMFEDEAFLGDMPRCHREIANATKGGIKAIVGLLVPDFAHRGEDGRMRGSNCAVIYSNGKYIAYRAKTLQPNYRIFRDDRHFFSSRKIALEQNKRPEDLLNPLSLTMRDGRKIKLGVMLCEDGWPNDYCLNPGKILAEKGADILCDISCSPWTWQKNRKRHQVIKELCVACHVPVVYVNNTGVQNTGKNLMVFDGASTVYNPDGEIVFEVPPYASGSYDLILGENMPSLPPKAQDDTKELYLALRHGAQGFLELTPPSMRKVIIGLSGGIDSSLAAALWADVLGPENVIGVNMPSKYNQLETKDDARELAMNLGIEYRVHPIQEAVDVIARETGVEEGTLAYENIQARVRMEILAALAQKRNGFFPCNSNKVELAFGYGTQYGDLAGEITILGDLIKREIYQVADYMNRIVFKRQVIPQRCFERAPTAELTLNQKDPFDYGNLHRRGYHDEMVRAFTEFRRNPEWFLDLYENGTLESMFLLDSGTLARLFPTPWHFIQDLEKHWTLFQQSYRKRIKGSPILIVSKRAFGTDLEESLLRMYFTKRYCKIRDDILRDHPFRVVLFGGTFDPAALHHRRIVEELVKKFDKVIVIPCGPRKDIENKPSFGQVSDEDRREMTRLNFDLPGVVFDFHDLDHHIFTPTYALQERYEKLYPHAEIWHAVGADLVRGGHESASEIQRTWVRGEEVWKTLNFAITARAGYELSSEDLPPHSLGIGTEYPGSSTMIREAIDRGEDVAHLLTPDVCVYIIKHLLYCRAS